METSTVCEELITGRAEGLYPSKSSSSSRSSSDGNRGCSDVTENSAGKHDVISRKTVTCHMVVPPC